MKGMGSSLEMYSNKGAASANNSLTFWDGMPRGIISCDILKQLTKSYVLETDEENPMGRSDEGVKS